MTPKFLTNICFLLLFFLANLLVSRLVFIFRNTHFCNIIKLFFQDIIMAKIPYPDSTDHNAELSHWYILCDVSDILQSAHLIILPKQGLDKSASKAL